MNKLYPLKFIPILKDKIWGGSRLRDHLGKKNASSSCGESWEISTVGDNISIVSEGFLEGNDLQELIEVYMGDLVGDKVYEKFGLEFPLLIKFIEASDDLSIQVHPDDKLALERHNPFGKTEMWYVMEAEKEARLISGFKRKINKEEYLEYLQSEKLHEILNYENVQKGDIYFIPAGRVHAIGAGIILAEIQQTSDITYRIFDYNRTGDDGKKRELHTGLALDAIDFNYYDDYKTLYEKCINKTIETVNCDYFTTNIIHLDQVVEKDFTMMDSFVVYLCSEGEVNIKPENQNAVKLGKGETLLIPAMLKIIRIIPVKESVLLEVYVKL